MKKLYAPWRSLYTKRVYTREKDLGCVFCKIVATTEDAAEFIIKRGTHCVTMLNKYPYNPGHLLIVPMVHADQLHMVQPEVRAELIESTSLASAIMTTALGAEGCNIGINIGKAAGAGIPEHLHMHILPRFFGDTNFLPTLADTKQISLDLHEIFDTLKKAFANPR